MKIVIAAAALAVMAIAADPGHATCQSEPEPGWRSQDVLKQRLTGQGWQVRRIKVDGGCHEVYALDDKGQRVEAYFHPVTFEPVATERN